MPIIEALDLNHDRLIDAAELAKASESLKKLDKNGDGKISREEAPSAESFRLADTNRDGSVTRKELREFLKRGRGQRSN